MQATASIAHRLALAWRTSARLGFTPLTRNGRVLRSLVSRHNLRHGLAVGVQGVAQDVGDHGPPLVTADGIGHWAKLLVHKSRLTPHVEIERLGYTTSPVRALCCDGGGACGYLRSHLAIGHERARKVATGSGAHLRVFVFRRSICRADDGQERFEFSPLIAKSCIDSRLLRGVRVLRNRRATAQQLLLRVARVSKCTMQQLRRFMPNNVRRCP